MNNKMMLDSIYEDFFGKDKNIDFKEDNACEESNIVSIDDLFVDDESKSLLKKIISYMEKYNKKEETNYISFNIIINSNDQKTIIDVSDILKYYSNLYGYVDSNNVNKISLYKIDKEDISDSYNNHGIVLISDLDALKMNDVNFVKKFIYNFKQLLSSKKITILCGNKDNINDFLFNDNELANNYFKFNIVGIKPDINDIYNNIINTININDELKVKLLDYISNTYESSESDYSSYVTNLLNYVSFNKDIPQVDFVKSIDSVFSELNELVGLQKVKNTLKALVDLINLKKKTKDALKINDVNLHMVFLGNPGTGKTTVARLIADILYNLKYIRENKLIEVSSKDLVAEYVGQTAVKTMSVIEKSKGGILFIDEAYALATKNNDNSFNGECIATLIKAMEDYRDDLVVIFAGYTKEMQDFLDSNSGIVSRIGYTLTFDDYTKDELKEIFKGMVKKSGFILEEKAIDVLDGIIDENCNVKNFGNARFIRNVFEKTVIKHASNTKNIKSKETLKTITKEDITC